MPLEIPQHPGGDGIRVQAMKGAKILLIAHHFAKRGGQPEPPETHFGEIGFG